MKTATFAAALFATLAPTLGAQAAKQEPAKPETETVYTFQIGGIRG